MEQTNGTITLIGSGEFSEMMGRVYRAILARAPSKPSAIFLDTPAGFELNADAISAKAAEYFSQRLQLDLHIASHKSKARATGRDVEQAIRLLRRADFIFAGPGSPSYTLRNWQGTPIWETLLNRFELGAHLVFASAAAIAVGASALPVYEIYKAGADLHWLDGMNLFAALGMNLAIVPHWNNAEGGTYDTRYCFMGETRFNELEKLLASEVVVLGIDEYTACIFDVAAQQVRVLGAGNVTIRCDGQEFAYASGETFSFAQLRAGTRPRVVRPERDETPIATVDETTNYLMHLARALDETQELTAKRELIDRAHNTMHELSADWLEASHTASREELAPYLEIIIEIRKQLRDAKQYALADEIRQRLAALDIVVEDSSSGTTWRRERSL